MQELLDISSVTYEARIALTPIRIRERGILDSFYCQATGPLLEAHDER